MNVDLVPVVKGYTVNLRLPRLSSLPQEWETITLRGYALKNVWVQFSSKLARPAVLQEKVSVFSPVVIRLSPVVVHGNMCEILGVGPWLGLGPITPNTDCGIKGKNNKKGPPNFRKEDWRRRASPKCVCSQ